MKKTNIGRNDPCHCGSGKKYKRCCLDKDSSSYSPAAELSGALQDMEFSSLDEAQAFADQFLQQKNQQAHDEFQGLSPEQMYCFLYSPFESPQYVQFKTLEFQKIDAPIWVLFKFMADGIGDQGIKATAKGNLPQKLCRDIFEFYKTHCGVEDQLPGFRVNKEEDFAQLHITRLVSELAGLIRKVKGHFVLSKKCQQMLASQQYGALYLLLFKAFTQKYNWAFGDGFQNLEIVQESFVFNLYLLSRFGNKTQHQDFYEQAFLTAFPMATDKIELSTYMTPEESVRNIFTLRCLRRFAEFFGLVSLKPLQGDKPYLVSYEVTKTDLLDELIQFNIAYPFSTNKSIH